MKVIKKKFEPSLQMIEKKAAKYLYAEMKCYLSLDDIFDDEDEECKVCIFGGKNLCKQHDAKVKLYKQYVKAIKRDKKCNSLKKK